MEMCIGYDHTQRREWQHRYKVSMRHGLQWFMQTTLVTSAWWRYGVRFYEKLLSMLLLMLLL